MNGGKCSKREESPREQMIREAVLKVRAERQARKERVMRPEEDMSWDQTDFREIEEND